MVLWALGLFLHLVLTVALGVTQHKNQPQDSERKGEVTHESKGGCDWPTEHLGLIHQTGRNAGMLFLLSLNIYFVKIRFYIALLLIHVSPSGL